MYIDIADPNTIFVTADPLGVDNREYYVKANINSINPVYQDNPGVNFPDLYKYPTMTRVVIAFNDGNTLDFECQDVVNQPGWSNGTQVELNFAVAAINASL